MNEITQTTIGIVFIILLICGGFYLIIDSVAKDINSNIVNVTDEYFEDDKGNVIPFELVVLYSRVGKRLKITWSLNGGYDNKIAWTDEKFLDKYLPWKERQ